MNRLQDALADCNEALRLQPGDGNAHGSRGLVYLKLRKWGLAIADYDAALRVNPKNADALYGRGVAKQLRGDKAGADTDIVAAKRIAPGVATDYASYGVGAP